MTNKTSRYYIDIIQERSWVWFGKLQTKYIVNEEEVRRMIARCDFQQIPVKK